MISSISDKIFSPVTVKYGIIFRVKNVALILTVLLSACVQAAWYWPFPSPEDNTNKPPRLHRLLEKANDFIELAEDESLKGDADKALDYYRQALDELGRVRAENPDRAETPEFAPLRNKIATCKAAIDTIRFEQVNSNIRAVSVTDTTELQRKWNKRHGIVDPDDRPPKPPVPAPEPPKETPAPSPDAQQSAQESSEPQQETAGSSQNETDASAKDELNDVLRQAAERLRANDCSAAEKLLVKIAEKYPDDLNVLMMRAAAIAGNGRLYAARKVLEQAVKAHPQSYMPHYNLAYVALELGEGRKAARQHYERGRELGGPANEDMERRLKND